MTRLIASLAPPDGPFGSPPVLDPFMIVVIVSALAAVGIIAGVVPAARAARIPPAEALRS